MSAATVYVGAVFADFTWCNWPLCSCKFGRWWILVYTSVHVGSSNKDDCIARYSLTQHVKCYKPPMFPLYHGHKANISTGCQPFNEFLPWKCQPMVERQLGGPHRKKTWCFQPVWNIFTLQKQLTYPTPGQVKSSFQKCLGYVDFPAKYSKIDSKNGSFPQVFGVKITIHPSIHRKPLPASNGVAS